MFGRSLKRAGTVAASMMFVTSLSALANVQSTSRCLPIEPIADQVNLFDSATAHIPVRQIEKGGLGKRVCSFEEKNGRYRIQLQLSVAWVQADQFRKAIPATKQAPEGAAGKPSEGPTVQRQRPQWVEERQRQELAQQQEEEKRQEEMRQQQEEKRQEALRKQQEERKRKELTRAQEEERKQQELAQREQQEPRGIPPAPHSPGTDYPPQHVPDIASRDEDYLSPPSSSPSPPRVENAPRPPLDINQYVSVLYATNRVIDHNDPSPIQLTSITFKRSQTLSFGSALVRVPEDHKIGEVERPTEITIFGFTYNASEDEKKHFTLKEIKRLDRNEAVHYLTANGNHSALVFVHGFNTPFKDAIFKTAQIAFDTQFQGVPVAFAWPSEGTLSITGYNYDRESASDSWDALLDLFHVIRDEAGITNIYVIAHSMGNQILLDALSHAHDRGNDLKLSEIIMASPDVARDVFVKRIGAFRLLAGGLTLYASSADKALMVSHKYWDSVRAGDIPIGKGPVTADGLDTIDITALGNDPFAFNHKVAGTRSVIDDIGRIISGANMAKRPTPRERSPQLIVMPANPPPTYWRYPN